ncbi:MAG: hypothetical protein ACT4OF_06880 [Caulobacteraceae bacterium]
MSMLRPCAGEGSRKGSGGDPMSDKSSATTPSYWALFAFALVIFGVKYLILMNGAVLYGRLIAPPPYDDVSYFVDGMQRLQAFQNGGVWAVMQHYWANLPHSPYSSFAAFSSFLVTGGDATAPYAVNALAAAVIAALLARAFRWSLVWSVLIFALLTALPWFDYLVTVFHPDYVAGFGVAVVCAILLWQDRTLNEDKRIVLFGIAAGLVWLVKPTSFPMSTILLGSALLLGAALSRASEGNWRGASRRLLIGVPVVLLTAGPYYVRQLPHIYAYVFDGLVTEYSTWVYRGTPEEHLFFYANVAKELLRFWPQVALASAAAVALIYFFRKQRVEAFRFVALLVLLAIAYAVPTIPDVKVPIYGCFIYALIVVTLALSARAAFELLRETLPARAQAAAFVIPAALAVSGAAQYSDAQMRFPRETSIETTRVYDGVFAVARDYALQLTADGQARPIMIYAPSPVTVATHAFQYRGLREGVDINVAYAPHETNIENLYQTATTADIVVVPDRAVMDRVHAYPVNALIPQFQQWLDSNNRLRRAAEIPWTTGTMVVYVASDGPATAAP